MFIELEKDEELNIRVGDRVWLFEANDPNEVWLHAASKGRKIYAAVTVTRSMTGSGVAQADPADGVRLNIVSDP